MDKDIIASDDSGLVTAHQPAQDPDTGVHTNSNDGSLRVMSHLWDPLRLSKAQLFASNTTRLLSLSRSISLSQSTEPVDPSLRCPEVLPGTSTPVECGNQKRRTPPIPSNDKAGSEQGVENLMHASSPPVVDYCESLCAEACVNNSIETKEKAGTSKICQDCLPHLPHDLPRYPTKTKCLKLIDKIWKGGLDYNLELIRQRNRAMSQQVYPQTDAHDCTQCVEVKQKLMSLTSCSDSGSDREMQQSADDKRDGDNLCMETTRTCTNPQNSVMCTVPTTCDHLHGAMEILPNEISKDPKDLVVCEQLHGQAESLDLDRVTGQDSTEISIPPPFKKARYSWQVKNKGKCEPAALASVGVNESSCDTSAGGSSGLTAGSASPPTALPVSEIDVDVEHVEGDVNRSSEDMDVSGQGVEDVLQFNDSIQDDRVKCSAACHDFSSAAREAEKEDVNSTCVQDQPPNSDSPNLTAKTSMVKKLEPSPRQQKTVARQPETSPGRPQRLSTEVYPSRQRRPSNRDFHMLTQALTQLDYVERWQCQHVAKAIVDNAINKTLEEMGLSPDTSARAGYTEQRSRIEDAGVSQAILTRGLRRYSPNSYRMRRLNPIINRLTRVSEHLFSDNLRGSLRSMNEAVGTGENPLEGEESDEDGDREHAGEMEVAPSQMLDLFAFDEGTISSGEADVNVSQAGTTGSLVGDTPQSPGAGEGSKDQAPGMSSSGCYKGEMNTSPTTEESRSMFTEKADDFMPEDSPPYNTETIEESSHTTEGLSAVVAIEESDLPSPTLAHKPAEHPLVLNSPSSNFILDQAVNAVIFERGLQF